MDRFDENREKLKYGTDKIVTYGINTGKVYNSNKYILVKFLEYYRDLYYNKSEKLDNSCLWLVLFTSRNFQELYNISKLLLDKELHEQFVRKVIDMNRREPIISAWELEKLNELVEVTKYDNAVKEGLNEGLEKGMEKGVKKTTIEYVKNMFAENLSIELISKITGKTKDEIMEIKNSL